MHSPEPTDARPLSKLLRLAVVTGISRAVQVHIDRGDDLNARDGNGQTPLMLAAARNKAAICKLLLDAGADSSLQDPAGRTAHEIALTAHAQDAASVIAASQIDLQAQAQAEFFCHVENGSPVQLSEQGLASVEVKGVDDPTPMASPAVKAAEPSVDRAYLTSIQTVVSLGEALAVNRAEAPTALAHLGCEQIPAAVDQNDDLEFDLSGWIVDEESSAPTADPDIAVAAGALQAAISRHVPIDSSDEWGDVDAFLPDRASPLSRAADTETRSLLRALLLRAIREGVASAREIDELSADEDGAPNPEARDLLLMVINDLGAEVDDWLGPWPSSATTDYNAPDESAEEEALLDEAFSFIDAASNHRNEPLRAYQREFQLIPLITAEEEISLAQTMERSLEAAIDALAAWPAGIARTVSAGTEVDAGLKPISWMSRGNVESDLEGGNESGGPDGANDENELEADAPSACPASDGDASFTAALRSLAGLSTEGSANPSDWRSVRDALSELNLSRGFMLELADIFDATHPEAQAKYLKAVAEYQEAREAMTCANLKLAFHTAKKYLYSGLPLDDLTQEANLGLLKAVDKYDWRRGFKFSTYATWWIRQQVSRHVADKNRTIRVPVHIFEKLQRVRRVVDAFEASHGRTAKAAEVAELVGMPTHKATELMRLLPEPVSLHDISIGELISAGAQDVFIQEDPMEAASAAELSRAVRSLLDTLDVKESQILCFRYGIGDQEPMTLDEVGQFYGVTRERIRQIESKLLRRLRGAAQFAREAIDVENSELPRKKRVSRVHKDVEEFIVEDKAELDKGEDGFFDEVESSKDQSLEQEKKSSPKGIKRSKPASIDAMLSLASELGIPYDDDRSGRSGRVWINFVGAPDVRHRKLARKLLDNGFAYWPGKGFWI